MKLLLTLTPYDIHALVCDVIASGLGSDWKVKEVQHHTTGAGKFSHITAEVVPPPAPVGALSLHNLGDLQGRLSEVIGRKCERDHSEQARVILDSMADYCDCGLFLTRMGMEKSGGKCWKCGHVFKGFSPHPTEPLDG